jgi:hypothetical protein
LLMVLVFHLQFCQQLLDIFAVNAVVAVPESKGG